MMDSDHLHTICETAHPPIHYLNAMSEQVKTIVKRMNEEKGVVCVCVFTIVVYNYLDCIFL